MKKHIQQWGCLSLTALAIGAFCGAARADINGSAFSTNLAAWPSELVTGPQQPFVSSLQQPFYSTSLASVQADGVPSAGPGATAVVFGETFTITNLAGAAYGPGPGTGTNYVLTGVGFVFSGYSSVPLGLHIFDVTGNLTSTNGLYNGSAANYQTAAPTPQGDLLGEGVGLNFTNNVNSGAEAIRYLSLQNGPDTYGDKVILASNHTYALEVSVPTTSGVYFFRQFGSPDPGGEGMQADNFTPTTVRTTPGYNSTLAIALYGYPATNGQAISANSSTNVVMTTNYWIDQFNALSVLPVNPYYGTYDYSAGQIDNIWIGWFGITPAIYWDNTNDAQLDTNGGLGGSLLLYATFVGGDQFEAMDGYGGITPALNGDALGLTSFECDVMFDSSSPVQTNYTAGVPGLVYFGNLQFGMRTSTYGQDYFGNGADTQVPQTMSNQWVHVKIPIAALSDPNLSSIVNVMAHIYGPYGAATASQDLIGTVKMWVDNIKFKAPLVLPPIPPPALRILPATAGTARFFTSNPQYTRTELGTLDTDQSWIGGPGDSGDISTPYSKPVSYSFTLSSLSANTSVQTTLWLVDADTSTYNGSDYTQPTELWLNIAANSPKSWVAAVAWKANDGGANPTNTELTVTNTVGVGTWTLTFTGQTNGNLMAPGWLTASNFTIADPNVATDFANPLTAFFGIQGNGSAYGDYDDYTKLSITNVAGVNELDVFANDTSIDTNMWSEANDTGTPSGYYQITNTTITTAYPVTINPIFVVTTNTPFWISWNVTTNGYGLAESATGTLPIVSLVSPQSFNGYTDVPLQCTAGATNWALIPKDCLAPGNQGYFDVVNPPPQN